MKRNMRPCLPAIPVLLTPLRKLIRTSKSSGGINQRLYSSAKKFNVVLYGVAECPPGTSKSARLEADLAGVVSVLSTLDATIQPQSIEDCYHLGKFNPLRSKPRPILVSFIRTTDVSNVLSKRAKLKRPYLIKPGMTREQRQAESVLMKRR